MIENIRLLTHESIVRKTTVFFAILMMVFTILLIWKWQQLPPEIPMFYSLPRSEDQLGSPLQLLLLPASALIIYVINVVLAAAIIRKERIAALILFIASGLSALLLFGTFVKIVFLIT